MQVDGVGMEDASGSSYKLITPSSLSTSESHGYWNLLFTSVGMTVCASCLPSVVEKAVLWKEL